MRPWIGLSAVISAGLLTSCASSIMQGYMGQPLEAAMAQYGPPTNTWDMPDGHRAFQWAINSSFTMPVTANTTVNHYGNTSYANTTVSGGQTVTQGCFYTMFARKVGEQWLFDSFKAPGMMCQ